MKTYRIEYKAKDPEDAREWRCPKVANVTAESPEEAVEKLRDMFGMFRLEQVGEPAVSFMTPDDYANG